MLEELQIEHHSQLHLLCEWTCVIFTRAFKPVWETIDELTTLLKAYPRLLEYVVTALRVHYSRFLKKRSLEVCVRFSVLCFVQVDSCCLCR